MKTGHRTPPNLKWKAEGMTCLYTPFKYGSYSNKKRTNHYKPYVTRIYRTKNKYLLSPYKKRRPPSTYIHIENFCKT